ncbi:hypothetical protein CFP71_28365 [Amycolatopsis thailandensis]|uniref:Uncharacterized protein n=1 Tax=Amycolatopsis thailandensis TaxID=589330 RepID=A0A229RUM8_9PSEU|nr:hypothetical protein [Amycolatopsis thailandensis]OXM50346.1 hypothetical protein CFP71_28365 [Amycolatopsis thailandensis]
MTRPAEHNATPDTVWSMLHAWAEEITSTDYSNTVTLETLTTAWRHRRRSLEAAIVDWHGGSPPSSAA